MAWRIASVSSGSGARPSRSLRLSLARMKAITASRTPIAIEAEPSQAWLPVAWVSARPAAASAMPTSAPLSS